MSLFPLSPVCETDVHLRALYFTISVIVVIADKTIITAAERVSQTGHMTLLLSPECDSAKVSAYVWVFVFLLAQQNPNLIA